MINPPPTRHALFVSLLLLAALLHIATIGSGGRFALAAATALMENTELSAREIVQRSMKIAADICIYSNQSVVIEEINA